MFWIFLGSLVGVALTAVYAAIIKDKSWKDNAPKFSKGGAAALILIPMLLGTLLASITTVGTGEIAVMTRFGRVTGQELGEGLHFKSPIDKSNKYTIKVNKYETTAAAASRDLQDANASLVLNYALEAGKVSEMHRTVGDKYEEKIIVPAVQEAFKAVTAKYNVTELITNRASVKSDVHELLVKRLGEYGISVRDLSITNFTFSAEFTNAIEKKQVAEQQAQQAKFDTQKAKEQAEAEIAKARGSAEAQRLQRQTLTDELLTKQFLEKWDGKMPLVMGSDGNILDISSLLKTKK